MKRGTEHAGHQYFRARLRFLAPIVFALSLNEIHNAGFKKTVQTVSYLPNFISWVIMTGSLFEVFLFHGPVTALLGVFGIDPLLFITDMIMGFGWSSIIYLAAISSTNPELHESAVLDRANRLEPSVPVRGGADFR